MPRILLAAAAAAALVALPAIALADCGNLTAAILNGDWQLRITVAPYAGSPNAGYPAVGTSAVTPVTLSSTCTAAGACTATMGAPGGNQAGIYDNHTGWYWDPGAVMTHSGASYSGKATSGGIGGPGLPPCRPPPGFNQAAMTLTVLEAVQSPSGTWRATVIAGTETMPSAWACNGGSHVTATTNLALLAVPAGAAFPASANLPCAAPAVRPAPAASLPAGTTPGNPDVSSISSALPTPASALGSPTHTLLNAAITVGLMLFITFPAQLFNKTLDENYEEIKAMTLRRFGWLRRFRRRAEREAGGLIRLTAFAAVVLGGAVLGGLNDPGFGFNTRSAATYIAVILSILIGVTVGALVGTGYRRLRHHKVEATLHALPAGLLVAAACVLVSRLTSFEPGYLYGIIAGLAFEGTLAKHEQGHTVVLSTAASLILAVLAWFVWIPVHAAAATPGAAFGAVLAADLLGCVFVGGLVGQVVGLMPLRFLPGGTLFEWRRAAWFPTFGIALFGMVEVMLNPVSSPAHSGRAPMVTAAVLFVLFGGSSVAFRQYFSRRERRRREEERGGAPAVPAAAHVAAAASTARVPAAPVVEPGARPLPVPPGAVTMSVERGDGPGPVRPGSP